MVTSIQTEGRRAPRADEDAATRYAKKREAIIAAAAVVINKRGVRAMTLADVSAAVGLIKNSLTYYFKKKEDLAVACYLDGIARFDEIVTEAMDAGDTGPERLRALIGLYLDLDKRIRLGQAPAIATFSDVRTLSEPNFAVVIERYCALFRKAQALLFDDCPDLSEDARVTRTNIALEQLYWSIAWLPQYEVDDYPRVQERLAAILINGLAKPDQTWSPRVLPAPGADEASRETFLRAATRLINQRGYRGASIDQISAELNLTKGSFYHHHDAKSDLVIACFERSFAVVRRLQLDAIALPASGWDRLASVAAALADFQTSERGPLLRSSAYTALPEGVRADMMQAGASIANRFAAMITDAISEGNLRAVDPVIAAQVLNAGMNAAAEIRYWTPNAAPNAAADLYARPLLLGLFTP